MTTDDMIVDERVRRVLAWLGELCGTALFCVLMALVVVLCCAASGYHWE